MHSKSFRAETEEQCRTKGSTKRGKGKKRGRCITPRHTRGKRSLSKPLFQLPNSVKQTTRMYGA